LLTFSLVGSPAFMAPEVFLLEDEAEVVHDSGYTTAADVWSLGATCFYLFSGGGLLGNSRQALKKIARSGSEWTMPPLPDRTPPKVCALLARMLRVVAAERPTVEQLLDDEGKPPPPLSSFLFT
jgi:serine/threonine protein kinase